MKAERQKKNKTREEAPVLALDIVYMVMALLPIETIFRCAAVCKSWYAVTKEPFFVKQVSLLQNKKTHILLQPTLENVTKLHLINVQQLKLSNLPLTTMLQDLKVMSSCEGLLSMASTKKLDPAVIYNPLTRETFVLPPKNSRMIPPLSIFYQQIGIGYDYATDKFKVLRAFSRQYASRFVKKYEVLTLGERDTTMWRRLCSPKCIGRLDEYEVSYCQGSLYLISKPGFVIKIVQFNLSNETFRQVVCQNISPKLKHKFISLFDDDEGSVLLAVGKETMVGFLELSTDDVAPLNPVFKLQSWNKVTGTEWVNFNVLTQVENGKYLVHLGFSDESVPDLRLELVAQYCTSPTEYINLRTYKLWNDPKSYAFKPSLLPLPRVSSLPFV